MNDFQSTLAAGERLESDSPDGVVALPWADSCGWRADGGLGLARSPAGGLANGWCDSDWYRCWEELAYARLGQA